jgi:hypothetical protein
MPSRMNFPTELRSHVFRHLSLPKLVHIGPASFLSLDRGERVAVALKTDPPQVIQLFAGNDFSTLIARFVIERHLFEPGGSLRRYHPGDFDFDDDWRVLLDHAVARGFPNRLLVRMLHHGITGEEALKIAAEMQRFDTVRALYHNDWYGELYFRETLREKCLQADDVNFLKWMWSPFVMRKDTSVVSDLYLWLLMCCSYDAVKCFSYLYHERSSYCCSSIVTASIEHEAVRITAFLIENCSAVQLKHYESVRRDAAYFHRHIPQSVEFYVRRRAVQHMRKRRDLIYANDGAEKCSHRFILPHMDFQRVRSDVPMFVFV